MGKTVPWCSWKEWTQVKAWLFADSAGDVDRGVAKVATWRLRSRVPLGADITATLVEAARQDPSFLPSSSGNVHAILPLADNILRHQYSMALVRMVNGITDSLQKGKVAVSVASLAESAGLARLLVDIRHEATHNELPSLATLRLGVRLALEWLQINYWDHQQRHLQACSERIAGILAGMLSSWEAASLKAYGQGASQVAADDDTQENADAAEQGYQGIEGQKQRRLLLTELRGLVPPSSAALLVTPLLEALSAGTTTASLPAQSQQQAHRQAGTSGKDHRQLASQNASEEAVKSLLKTYPSLQPLMLHALVEQLCNPAATAQLAIDPATCVHHLERLLPTPGNSRPAGSKAKRKRAVADTAAPSSGPQLDPEELKELLRMLQHARLATAPTLAAGQSTSAPQLAHGTTDAAAAAILRGIDLLLAALTACSAGPSGDHSLQHKAAALTGLACLSAPTLAGGAPSSSEADAIGSGKPSTGKGGTVTQLQAAAQLQRRLLERQQQQSWREDQEQHAACKRWRRVHSWRPCAIGCLPSAHDANGALPMLDLPPRQLCVAADQQDSALAAEPGSSTVDDQPAVAGARPPMLAGSQDGHTVAPSETPPRPASMHAVHAGAGTADDDSDIAVQPEGHVPMASAGGDQSTDVAKVEQRSGVHRHAVGTAAGSLLVGGWMVPDVDAARLAESVQLLL